MTIKYGKYGKIAIAAVELCRQGKTPEDAWTEAAVEYNKNNNKKQPSQEGNAKKRKQKDCPKQAFLGLCEDGYVKGIAKDKYSETKENKKYAIDAVRFIREDETFLKNKCRLWAKINEAEDKDITCNNQLDVVFALFDKGYIERQGDAQ